MSKLVETNEKIADAVTGAYKKVEDTVVGGYQKVQDAFVGGYQKVEDACVGKLFAHDGETVEEAKERLRAAANSDRETR